MDKYIVPIDKDSVPYSFDIQLNNEIYMFTVNYNNRFDYFTLDVSQNGSPIFYGIKLVYGNPIFNFTNDPRFSTIITPKDEGGTQTRAGYGEIGETVYLFIEDDAA